MKKAKTKRTNKWNETLLVTGGAGFIGSNYLNTFVKRNPLTLYINVDLLTYAGSRKNILVEKEKNYVFKKADIRNVKHLEKIFKQYRPFGVINFAAESHVDLSIKNPNIFVETNVLGVANLLWLSRRYGVKRFLQISTDEVYGPSKNGEPSKKEADVLNPTNPYSASKAGAEHIAFSYHLTFGMDVVMTRSSNNYGPNQDTTKLLPKFIRNLTSGKKVPLYSRGEQMRTWLHVLDNVEAVELVYRKGKSGQIYNIAGDFSLTNFEMTKRLIGLAKRDESAIEYVPDRLGHDFRYDIDCDKIKTELGWVPTVKFEEGLKSAFAHYAKGKI